MSSINSPFILKTANRGLINFSALLICFGNLLNVSRSQCPLSFLLSLGNFREINSKAPRNEFIEPILK